MSYLRAFIIGSSFFVFVPFFLKVQSIPKHERGYSYYTYSIIAPFYLGLMTAMALYLFPPSSYSLLQRYAYIGLISPMIVSSIAYFFNLYPGKTNWSAYFIRLTLKHLFTFLVIVRSIDIHM